jgi:flagellar motor switch/type III secretory pathway protein FliN
MPSAPELTTGITLTAPALSTSGMEEHAAWPMISRLPVMLAVTIPLTGFKVRDLLAVSEGQTIETAWAVTRDIPLRAGQVQLGWGEFEVVEQRMALRLTRLT